MAADHLRDQLCAVALDVRLDLRHLERELPWGELHRTPHAVHGRLADGAEVAIYSMGALVVHGSGAVAPAVQQAVESNTGARVLRDTEEGMEIIADPGAETVSVGWDRVVLPEVAPATRAAIALLLAQSAALERHEDAIEPLVERAADLARALARKGRVPWLRAPVRRIAGIAVQRLELARWFFLLDRPEATWEDPRVAALYDALFEHLEIAERHAALEYKLSRVEHTLEVVASLWEGQRSRMLEWAIIGLIALEIGLTLVRMGGGEV